MSTRIDPAAAAAARLAEATAVAGHRGASRAAAVEAAPAVPSMDSVVLSDGSAGLQQLGRELAATPAGIDLKKVESLRAAIAEGRYAIDPETIATRMLAMEHAMATGA